LALSRNNNEVFWNGRTGAEFFCSVGHAEPKECSSPYTLPALSPGTYLLRVWQRDTAGRVSEPAMMSWTIADNRLRIFLGPPRKTTKKKAFFRFSGQNTTCQLDRRAAEPCASQKAYRGLRLGRHVFVVRDAEGNTQRHVWRVVKKKKRR
jgi:hypothetical protein